MPILIPNPRAGDKTRHALHLDTGAYLQVPCGHCQECIGKRQFGMVQRAQLMNLYYHLFFVTLTYNHMIPTLYTSKGVKYHYADFTDIQNMMKRFRKDNPLGRDVKYFCVRERGKKGFRPHFHMILAVEKQKTDDYYTIVEFTYQLKTLLLNKYWVRNVSKSTKKPKYKHLCTYHEGMQNGVKVRNFDVQYINESSLDQRSVAFYITKYMLKVDDRLYKFKAFLAHTYPVAEFNYLWKHLDNKYIKSIDWGLKHDQRVQDYISKCVKSSLYQNHFPQYYDIKNGKPMPLSRFYRSLVPADDYLHFLEHSELLINGEFRASIPLESSDVQKARSKLRKFNTLVDSKGDIAELFSFGEDNISIDEYLKICNKQEKSYLCAIHPDKFDSDFQISDDALSFSTLSDPFLDSEKL